MRPHVHRGFLYSWSTNNLNERLVDRVQQLVQGIQSKSRTDKVYVTGASTARPKHFGCRRPYIWELEGVI